MPSAAGMTAVLRELTVAWCRQFHAALGKLLRPDGVYSFFQGFSGDNACFHDVCCRVVASELDHLGLDVQHIPLPVSRQQLAALASVSNPYWQLDTYLLPVCPVEGRCRNQET